IPSIRTRGPGMTASSSSDGRQAAVKHPLLVATQNRKNRSNMTGESPRVLLCYGDSNTWGFDPATQQRFPRNVRWPGRLQAALGDSWQVIEEGLNGRTTVLDSVLLPGRNGLAYLGPCLETHAPIDVVLIYLGTSDLADRYAMTATDIARGAGRLATTVA